MAGVGVEDTGDDNVGDDTGDFSFWLMSEELETFVGDSVKLVDKLLLEDFGGCESS